MNNQSTKDKDARSSNAMAATSHPLATEEALKYSKWVEMQWMLQLLPRLFYL